MMDGLDCQRERDARRESLLSKDSAALDIGFVQHHLDGRLRGILVELCQPTVTDSSDFNSSLSTDTSTSTAEAPRRTLKLRVVSR